MSLDSPKDIGRQRIQELATEALAQGSPTAWFESVYAQCEPEQIPWALMEVNPYIQDWLETEQIQGEATQTAAVVGCGFGDDAEALNQRGFQVTAFDISASAIAQCRQRFPNSGVNYQVADLFALDPSWKQTFDLVVESRTIQALPLEVRSPAIEAIATLVAPDGSLLIVTYYRDREDPPDGPPWPLSDGELNQFQALGLTEMRRKVFLREESSTSILQLHYRSVS
ncbi:MAG: class I SAM-dependent methyltransferase [Desertifilum sp. SIO1I2]|nr:class I SAM-dependent methyltransferase [Desertifilum sp. SIO1I2]